MSRKKRSTMLSHEQPHNRLQLFRQVRIVADFEGAGQVWLQAMFVPDAAYTLLTDSHRFGHGARAPLRRVGGFLLRGSPDDLLQFGWRDRRPAPRGGGHPSPIWLNPFPRNVF